MVWKQRLSTDDLEALNKAYGATKEDIDILSLKYPNCPESLIYLLENIDGTYWRKYGENEVTVCILGSDVEEYPYYLLSTQEMIESSKEGEDVSYLLEYQDEEDAVDSKINPEGFSLARIFTFRIVWTTVEHPSCILILILLMKGYVVK